MADALILTGPTASGKSELAIRVAARLDGEIISADAGQVYRHLDIGTAKPTPIQQRLIPHHGIDLIEPYETYGAGRFVRDAERWVREIAQRGRVPIITGGTAFFLYALLNPLFDEPDIEPVRKERLRQYLNEKGTEDLARWLGELDPASATALSTWGGRHRIIRALEVALLSGRTLTTLQQLNRPRTPKVSAPIYILSWPREELYERIDSRVNEMLAKGLVQEVTRALYRGYSPSAPAFRLMGYREAVDALVEGCSADRLQERVRSAHHRLARMQLTWFRNKFASAIVVDGRWPVDALADFIANHWRLSMRSLRT